MAVALVSTGVQFPDSTIQTTAASGAAGLTLIGSSTATASGGATWSASVTVTNWSNTYKYLVWTVQGNGNSTSSGNFNFWYNNYRATNAYEYVRVTSTSVNPLISASDINPGISVVTNNVSVYGVGTIFGTSASATYDGYPVLEGYLYATTRGVSFFAGAMRRDVAGAGQITSVQFGSVSGGVDAGSFTLTIYGVKT